VNDQSNHAYEVDALWGAYEPRYGACGYCSSPGYGKGQKGMSSAAITTTNTPPPKEKATARPQGQRSQRQRKVTTKAGKGARKVGRVETTVIVRDTVAAEASGGHRGGSCIV
jgi:hypothetical protein